MIALFFLEVLIVLYGVPVAAPGEAVLLEQLVGEIWDEDDKGGAA